MIQSVRSLLNLLMFCIFVIFLLKTTKILAAPQGPQIISGQVKIHSNSANHTTEIHAGNNSIIHYDSFNIQPHETVHFIQPNISSRVLNRIVGPDPTQIHGKLFANGQVYLINPSGIIFGPNSLVNTGGLFAAAASLADQNFIQGIDKFTQISGPVSNEGLLKGKVIHLIGKHVANFGSIVADRGIVSLSSGDDILLGEQNGHFFVKISTSNKILNKGSGIEQSGNIKAEGGRVILSAGDIYSLAVVQNGDIKAKEILIQGGERSDVFISGNLDTSSPIGGAINILGEKISLNKARLNASGKIHGGEISVGSKNSNEHTQTPTNFITVDENSFLIADAGETGNGGSIILWADQSTRFAGTISSRGGRRRGNGGFVEVSGRRDLFFSGNIDLSSPFGIRGTLLLDPTNITIQDPNPQDDDDIIPDTSTQGGGNFYISEEALENLSDNANLILEATNNVTIEDLSDNLLDLQINNSGSITITADSDGNGNGNFTMNIQDTIQTQGGSITITGEDITVGNIDTTQGTGTDGDLTITANNEILEIQQINSRAITLSANEGITLNDNITADNTVTLNADMNNDGSGSLILSAPLTTSNDAINIDTANLILSNSINAGSGNITYNDTSGSALEFGINGPFTNTTLNKISSNNLTINATGDITLNGVTRNDTDGITGRLSINSSEGKAEFKESSSELDPSLTITVPNTIEIDETLSTHGGSLYLTSTGNNVEIKDPINSNNQDINITSSNLSLSSTVNSGTKDVSLTANNNIDVTLKGSGTESDPFDLNNQSLALITADDLTINTQGSGVLTIEGVSTEATENINDLVTLKTVTGDVIFQTTPSTFNKRLTVESRDDIRINVDLNTNGTTTLTADSNDNGSGDLIIAGNLSSNNNNLFLKGADFNLTGSTNSGNGNTTLTAAGEKSIGLVGASADFHISDTELFKISTNDLTLITEGNADVTVDAITAASTENISGSLILTPNDDVIFSGNDSTLTNDLILSPSGQITIGKNLISTEGYISFNGPTVLCDDVTVNLNTTKNITFANTIDSDSGATPRKLITSIPLGGTTLFNGAIGTSNPLKSLNPSATETLYIGAGSIETTEEQNFPGLVILTADTTITATDVTFGSTVDSDSTPRDLNISSSGTVDFNGDVGIASSPLDILSVVTSTPLNIDQNFKANTISLHSASDSTGDLSFSSDVEFFTTTLTLRAGDDTGGAGTQARVDAINNSPTFRGFNGGDSSPTSFTIRQDRAITDTDMPQTSQFPGGISSMTTTLDSDDSTVTLNSGLRFSETSLNLLSESGSTINDTLNLNSLDITGTASLDKDITATTLMTFRGATTVTEDITLEGETLTFLDTLDSDATERNLSLNANGVTTLTGDVGVTNRFSSLTTDAAGSTQISSSQVLTTEDLYFLDALNLTLSGDQTLNSQNGTLGLSNTTEINKANGDLTLGGGNNIDIDANLHLSSGSLTLDNAYQVSGNLTASQNITLSVEGSFNGENNQIIDAQNGTLQLNGPLTKTETGNLTISGATTDLNANITVNSGDLTLTDAFTTTGDLLASGNLTLSAPGIFDSSNHQRIDAQGGNLQVASTLNKTDGNLILAGATALDVNGDMQATNDSIIIEDLSNFSGNLTAGKSVTFLANATMDGVGDQSITAGTDLNLEDISVVKITEGAFSLSGSNTIAFNQSSITSSGAQVYAGPVVLEDHVSITGGGNINFTSLVDGPYDFSLNTTGDINFNAPVGSISPLGEGTGPAIEIQSSGNTVFASTVATRSGITQTNDAGTITFRDNVLVGGGNTDNIFNNNVILDGASFTSAKLVTFGNSSSDTLTLEGNASIIDTSSSNQAITINSTVNGNQDLTLRSGTAPINLNSSLGNSHALSDLRVEGGPITVSQKIYANDIITLTSLGDLNINGDIDPTQIFLSATDNILLMQSLTASDLIQITAGTDGSGSFIQSVGATLSATSPSGDIYINTGNTSGDINLADSLTSGDTIVLNSPAGLINQSSGELTATNLNIYALMEVNLNITASHLTAQSILGDINLKHTGMGNLIIDNVNTSSGDITIEGLGGGDIFVGLIDASDHTLNLSSSGDIQDAQDDKIIDLSSKQLNVIAQGDIGGSPLSGTTSDPEGAVEISSPDQNFNPPLTEISILDLTPKISKIENFDQNLEFTLLPITQTSLSKESSPPPPGSEFLIGRMAYRAQPGFGNWGKNLPLATRKIVLQFLEKGESLLNQGGNQWIERAFENGQADLTFSAFEKEDLPYSDELILFRSLFPQLGLKRDDLKELEEGVDEIFSP